MAQDSKQKEVVQEKKVSAKKKSTTQTKPVLQDESTTQNKSTTQDKPAAQNTQNSTTNLENKSKQKKKKSDPHDNQLAKLEPAEDDEILFGCSDDDVVKAEDEHQLLDKPVSTLAETAESSLTKETPESLDPSKIASGAEYAVAKDLANKQKPRKKTKGGPTLIKSPDPYVDYIRVLVKDQKSKYEVVDNATKVALVIRTMIPKLPKRFLYTDAIPLYNLALEINDDVKRANSVFFNRKNVNRIDIQNLLIRLKYWGEAKATLQALMSRITILLEYSNLLNLPNVYKKPEIGIDVSTKKPNNPKGKTAVKGVPKRALCELADLLISEYKLLETQIKLEKTNYKNLFDTYIKENKLSVEKYQQVEDVLLSN